MSAIGSLVCNACGVEAARKDDKRCLYCVKAGFYPASLRRLPLSNNGLLLTQFQVDVLKHRGGWELYTNYDYCRSFKTKKEADKAAKAAMKRYLEDNLAHLENTLDL